MQTISFIHVNISGHNTTCKDNDNLYSPTSSKLIDKQSKQKVLNTNCTKSNLINRKDTSI